MPAPPDEPTAFWNTVVRERSLPRSAEVKVHVQGRTVDVPVGTLVRQLLPDRMHDRLVVAGLLDHKAVSLTTAITSDCDVRPLTTGHWEGQRVYRTSAALVALEAAHRLEGYVTLQMGPSIGFAQQMLVRDPLKRDLGALSVELERNMLALVEDHCLLREEWWTVEEAREYFRRQGSPAATLLDSWREMAVSLVTYGKVYALSLGPLLPDTGMLGPLHVTPGDGVLLLAYGSEAAALPLASSLFQAHPGVEDPGAGAATPPLPPGAAARTLPSRVAPSPPSATPPLPSLGEEPEVAFVERHARRASAHVAGATSEQERWLAALGVESVGAMNHACVNGDISQLIRVSEGFHEKRIGTIADEIRDRHERGLRVVCIAGPSSSGKTTFIQRLEVQLQVNGLRPVGLSLDDYFVDRERTPRDTAGDYDFEAFEALDVALLGAQLRRLLAGETVKLARFDFAAGLCHPEGGAELRMAEDQILLLEGIHGLNPRLLVTVAAAQVFRVFACPLAQLPFDRLSRVHASDVRLLRRIVRDRHSRGANAAQTIERWPSVRAGERRHIFPFQHHADAVVDTALTYELNVLRVFAERYLLEVPQNHAAYTTAFRLIRLLDRFVTIYPDHVPPTSILREFIGGSGFRY